MKKEEEERCEINRAWRQQVSLTVSAEALHGLAQN